MESESTNGSSARSTYRRADNSVNIYICYTGAHASSSCCPGAHRAAMLEHVEQLLSRSRYRCSTRAHGAGAVASLEHREQLCSSMWSSGSLAADTAAPLEHMEQQFPGAQRAGLLEHVEQRLSGSRYRCSNGAHGAAASLEHREQLCWSTWSSGSLGADTGAPVEHYGAAASLEHTDQLCWSMWSSGSLGADAGAPVEHYGAAASWEHREQLCWRLGARRAVALWEQIQAFLGAAAFRNSQSSSAGTYAEVELLNLLPERCCSMFYSGGTVSAQRKPLLHVLQHSCCVLQGSRYSICYSGATVSALREPLLHTLQHSCSQCSGETTVSCAEVEHL